MHRASDDETIKEQSIVSFNRKISVEWTLAVLGAFALFLGTMYFQQHVTSDKVLDISNDVKQIRLDVQQQGTKAVEDNFTLRDINRRLSTAELQIEALRAQKVSK